MELEKNSQEIVEKNKKTLEERINEVRLDEQTQK